MEAIKERVSSYWTKRSADFAKLREKELESELAGLWLSEIEAQLPKETGLRILDVGTGSGFFAVLLAKKGHRVTGIDLTPHMLRRYFANMRRKAGWRLELIQQALGHKHIDTTVKYLNIVDDELLEASEEFYAKNSALYGVKELL